MDLRRFPYKINAFVFLLFILVSCNNSNEEIELRKKELELKERELELERANSSGNSEEESNYDNYETNSNTPRQKSADEIRQDLYNKEMENPKDYLSVTYNLNYRVISGKDEIIGTIYNNASLASYKDVVLTVVYSTKTDTELSRENFVVYDYVDAGGSRNFNIKTYSPEGTKKIGVYINSAVGQ